MFSEDDMKELVSNCLNKYNKCEIDYRGNASLLLSENIEKDKKIENTEQSSTEQNIEGITEKKVESNTDINLDVDHTVSNDELISSLSELQFESIVNDE